MRLFWFVILSFTSGHDDNIYRNGILSKNEFLAMAESFAKRTMTKVDTKLIQCDSNLRTGKYGTMPCYVLNANKTEPRKLYQAIFLTESNSDEAEKYVNEGIDEVRAIFPSDPECTIIQYDLEKLTDTQVGPGTITISASDAERVNEGWKVGSSVTYKTPYKAIAGGGSLSISGDISKSIIQSTSRSLGARYDIPGDTTCTPHLLRFSIMCNNLPSRATYYREKKEKINRWSRIPLDDPAKRLLPINRRTGNYFHTVNGCIDLSRN